MISRADRMPNKTMPIAHQPTWGTDLSPERSWITPIPRQRQQDVKQPALPLDRGDDDGDEEP